MSNYAKLLSDLDMEQLIKRDTLLGSGRTRDVYAVIDNDNVVIKEINCGINQPNFVEFTVWQALQKMKEDILGNIQNFELDENFAICFAISASGKYLMMERLYPLSIDDDMSKIVVPDWLNDKKRSAFGKTKDGYIKVSDYASIDFYSVLNPKNWVHV